MNSFMLTAIGKLIGDPESFNMFESNTNIPLPTITVHTMG